KLRRDVLARQLCSDVNNTLLLQSCSLLSTAFVRHVLGPRLYTISTGSAPMSQETKFFIQDLLTNDFLSAAEFAEIQFNLADDDPWKCVEYCTSYEKLRFMEKYGTTETGMLMVNGVAVKGVEY